MGNSEIYDALYELGKHHYEEYRKATIQARYISAEFESRRAIRESAALDTICTLADYLGIVPYSEMAADIYGDDRSDK